MPDFKISELAPCNTLSGSEFLPILQKDILNKDTPSTVAATLTQLSNFIKDYIIPPGTIWTYAVPIDKKDVLPPSGWLLCDGSAYAIAKYSRLYKAIGDLYGVTTTPGVLFKVPSIKGRFVLGFSSYNRAIVPNFGNFLGQSLTIGKIGGEYNTTLTEASMPRHTHTLNNQTPPRSHLCYPDYTRISADAGTVTGRVKQQQGQSVGFFQSGKNGKRDGDGSDPDYIELGEVTTRESGQTQQHPTTPPYICLNHIIKY